MHCVIIFVNAYLICQHTKVPTHLPYEPLQTLPTHKGVCIVGDFLRFYNRTSFRPKPYDNLSGGRSILRNCSFQYAS